MEPWHVIKGQDGGPYAVKTAIGWVVNRPIRKLLKDTENKPLYLAVNWISVMEIEKLLVEQYNTDFPERMYDDKDEMSQEENSFCSPYRKPQGLKMGITVLDCHSRMRRLKCPTTDVLLNSA